jgi:hypothetical protein
MPADRRFFGHAGKIEAARSGANPCSPRLERAVPDGCRNGNGATAAILDAGANRAAQECSPQEGKQGSNKTAKHDRGAHHLETEG